MTTEQIDCDVKAILQLSCFYEKDGYILCILEVGGLSESGRNLIMYLFYVRKPRFLIDRIRRSQYAIVPVSLFFSLPHFFSLAF